MKKSYSKASYYVCETQKKQNNSKQNSVIFLVIKRDFFYFYFRNTLLKKYKACQKSSQRGYIKKKTLISTKVI